MNKYNCCIIDIFVYLCTTLYNAMRKTLTFLFMIIWATILSAYCANTTTWHFRPIPSTNILPTNEVRKLYKDSDGFMRISTNNGLVRYDGYTYLSFRYRGSEQLLSGMCSALCEDNHQRLWVGTNNGLFVPISAKALSLKLIFRHSAIVVLKP